MSSSCPLEPATVASPPPTTSSSSERTRRRTLGHLPQRRDPGDHRTHAQRPLSSLRSAHRSHRRSSQTLAPVQRRLKETAVSSPTHRRLSHTKSDHVAGPPGQARTPSAPDATGIPANMPVAESPQEISHQAPSPWLPAPLDSPAPGSAAEATAPSWLSLGRLRK